MERPRQGEIKCNTDKVSRDNPRSNAYSFCLRDEREELIYAHADAIGVKSNTEVEVIAVFQAITYCNTCSIQGINIETDSLVVIKMLKARNSAYLAGGR